MNLPPITMVPKPSARLKVQRPLPTTADLMRALIEQIRAAGLEPILDAEGNVIGAAEPGGKA